MNWREIVNTLEIIILAISLAMDAFAVSICKGVSMKKMNWKKAIITGLYFGIFQAMMPLIGYALGSTFSDIINKIDHWIIFVLLSFIGINMIRESRKADDNVDDGFGFKTMILLALATSIDALAVGVTFAFLNVNIGFAIICIGIITMLLSCLGVKIGNLFGLKFKSKAELIGGIMLIILGTKILLEHLGII